MNRKLKQACHTTLWDVFGVKGYRPGQKAAAETLLSGRDLLCILPTGAGKSLCWQLPAVVHEGLTVVVSPLIALMHDQVEGLLRRGIPAVALNSLMSSEERENAVRRVRDRSVHILFVSPERLETAAFHQLCKDCPPWLLVVDEAHCIVQWGQEFRPAYSSIGLFVNWLARRPVICAMTATADAAMQQQILENLGLHRAKRVILPALRKNLSYHALLPTDRTETILQLASDGSGPTVIFCRSRARTEQLAELLRRHGRHAAHYHAGLDREERIVVQQRFREGQLSILTATTAFGMGVDIPGIRRVIHDQLPDDVTDLLQQSGRAGRDGHPSQCIILMDPADLMYKGCIISAMYVANRRHPIKRRKLMMEHWLPLRVMLRACMASRCIPQMLSRAMGQRVGRCGVCSACTGRQMMRVLPDLPRMERQSLRLWLLQLMTRDVRIDSESLREAAQTGCIPDDLPVQQRDLLQQAVGAIRRGEMRLWRQNIRTEGDKDISK